MNDTPITDALLDDMGAGWPDRWAEMLKQFERDLIDARAELAEAKAKITSLKGEAQYGVDLFQRAMRAESELAYAQKDAERYRWLRVRHENTVMDIYNSVSPVMIKPEILDATIDAAMKEKNT